MKVRRVMMVFTIDNVQSREKSERESRARREAPREGEESRIAERPG